MGRRRTPHNRRPLHRLIRAELGARVAPDRVVGINPQAYLTDIIGRIADYPIHKIDDLLPWQWKS